MFSYSRVSQIPTARTALLLRATAPSMRVSLTLLISQGPRTFHASGSYFKGLKPVSLNLSVKRCLYTLHSGISSSACTTDCMLLSYVVLLTDNSCSTCPSLM